ncbi:MAG: hypothetical protein CRU78_16660 [Candidatus Accumulibacter phosphatis]|uniref:Uncharacterized protein n=1 Tax=Candidatus Accumulibacter phosphatis TaxID=327160 RepID=A0A6A7RWZ8_9PROT|nr:hypothetical protein [Candidatus Accumulibacter phosphatis]
MLFEALTLMLAPTMSILVAGRLWRVIDHHAGRMRTKEIDAGVRATKSPPTGPSSNPRPCTGCLGRTITRHLPGVLKGFQAGKRVGVVEAVNRAL